MLILVIGVLDSSGRHNRW